MSSIKGVEQIDMLLLIKKVLFLPNVAEGLLEVLVGLIPVNCSTCQILPLVMS